MVKTIFFLIPNRGISTHAPRTKLHGLGVTVQREDIRRTRQQGEVVTIEGVSARSSSAQC